MKPKTGDALAGLLKQKDAEIERLCATIEKQDDQIERLRRPYRAADAEDWEYLMSALHDGGRARFWKVVLTEARAALEAK